MAAKTRRARLTRNFLDRVEATGLTDAAAARAIGVTRQYYSAVKNGKENPSISFMAGAVQAGLADSFDGVAELVPATEVA